MTRPTALLLMAIFLVIFGIYQALHLPAMIIGPPAPLLLIGFLLEAVLAIAAGIGVWRGTRWAPTAIILLGASVALMAVIEVALGIVALLRALLEAGVAILVSLLMASYVREGSATRTAKDGR